MKNITEPIKLNLFLNEEFFSVNDGEHNYKTWTNEKMEDRHIYTGERYKNIFELRHIKHKFLIEDMPTKVKNYIFIRYEDLMHDFYKTMQNIKSKGLPVKNEKTFPLNTKRYKKTNTTFKEKSDFIPRHLILNNPSLNKFYEKKLGYL